MEPSKPRADTQGLQCLIGYKYLNITQISLSQENKQHKETNVLLGHTRMKKNSGQMAYLKGKKSMHVIKVREARLPLTTRR